MVALSIRRVSASSCLCRTRRSTQLRQCSRVSGSRLESTTHYVSNIYWTAVNNWLRLNIHSQCLTQNLLFHCRTSSCRCSHLSCVLSWLFADFHLTTSLGCRLAWNICLNTPVGAAKRNILPSNKLWRDKNEHHPFKQPIWSVLISVVWSYILSLPTPQLQRLSHTECLRSPEAHRSYTHTHTHNRPRRINKTHHTNPVRCFCAYLFGSGFPWSSHSFRKAQPQLISPLSPVD